MHIHAYLTKKHKYRVITGKNQVVAAFLHLEGDFSHTHP